MSTGMSRLAAERAGELVGAAPCPCCEFTIIDEVCQSRQRELVTSAKIHICEGPNCGRWRGKEPSVEGVALEPLESPEPAPVWLEKEGTKTMSTKTCEIKDKPCPDCGTLILRSSERCKKCNNRVQAKARSERLAATKEPAVIVQAEINPSAMILLDAANGMITQALGMVSTALALLKEERG